MQLHLLTVYSTDFPRRAFRKCPSYFQSCASVRLSAVQRIQKALCVHRSTCVFPAIFHNPAEPVDNERTLFRHWCSSQWAQTTNAQVSAAIATAHSKFDGLSVETCRPQLNLHYSSCDRTRRKPPTLCRVHRCRYRGICNIVFVKIDPIHIAEFCRTGKCDDSIREFTLSLFNLKFPKCQSLDVLTFVNWPKPSGQWDSSLYGSLGYVLIMVLSPCLNI